VLWEKMTADGKPARGCTRIFTGSARKKTGKKFWRIRIKLKLT
jgi:hypothetical protein